MTLRKWAVGLKKENPARTATQVARILRAQLGWSPSDRTLQRHFASRELNTRPDRYLDEVIDVLAAQAPDLHEALQRAQDEGLAYLILDGKVFSADRCGQKTTSRKGNQIDLWYSGKAHEHGGNIQALSQPTGFPVRVSDVEPGWMHDLTCAREHVLGALYAADREGPGLPTLADGAPCTTSPPAPARSVTSSKPHSYSPISNTAGSRESR